MAAPYDKVKKIFLEALDVPMGAARTVFIEEACGTDIELRQFVLGMMAAHEQAMTPVPEGKTKAEEPATVGITKPALDTGVILGGKYKIIEMIAEGGMGAVYRASRVGDMRMEVAIKVIKPGMDSQQVLARFNIERQALAIMKHDNIARVFDAGMTPLGMPYFVMELVRGISITKFCDETKLPVMERLELFEKVCSAVQHAHHKGIVHRDLKPGNILVAMYDNKPVPKVIDFGLAKSLHQPLTDDELNTKFGTFVGTWLYTAPEQARLNNLDIDTRADIYSLGVILYELLTGSTPLGKAELANIAFDEVVKIIQSKEPIKPSTKIHSSDQLPSLAALRGSEPLKLERMVRGELDWIVMKALDKDRNRRYASANDLAEDLQRFRNHEPVKAGPPTFVYKASKYLRRHWQWAAAAGLLFAVTAVGAVVSSIGWRKAVMERERADVQTDIAVAVNTFLRDLLSEADPAVQIKPDQTFVSNITVKKALDKAAEKVGVKFVDKPLVEAAIRHTMGKTYMGLGDLPNARIQLEKADQLRKKHAGENDPDRLESLYELGWLDIHDTKYPDAERRLKEMVERREKVLGANDPATLKGKYAWGLLLEQQNKLQEAKGVFDEVWKEQKRLFGDENLDTLKTMELIARIRASQGQIEAAIEMQRFVALSRKKQLGDGHPETLIAKNNLAQVMERNGSNKELLRQAESIYSEIINACKQTIGLEHPLCLSFRCNLAANHLSLQRVQDSISAYRELLPIMKRVLTSRGDDYIGALQNYASALSEGKDYKAAEDKYLEAIDNCIQTYGIRDERTQMVIGNIISLYQRMNLPQKAAEYQKKIIDGAKE